MKYSTNYHMNKPELSEQYRLNHWNDNTDIIDTELKRNADNITTAETALQNAISEESSRATTAETALQNITDSTFKTALLNFCYPIGSLYWSSKSDNPSTLFGGTWVQIKDRFIWAKGDSDTVNATGGSKTVTLSVSNLPSHSHSMNHNHTGSVSGSVGATDTNHTHNYSFSHSHNFHIDKTNGGTTPFESYEGKYSVAYRNISGVNYQSNSNFTSSLRDNLYFERDNITTNLSIAPTSISGTTGNMSQNSSHSHSWSGSVTIDTNTANTGSVGSGTAHENMPPYIVKFCWERIA